MPTIREEATKIVSIIQGYNQEKTKELIIKLDEEVGKKSEIASVKEFLSHLRKVVDKPLPPPSIWLWVAFYALVTFHILIVSGVTISFFVLPFLAPWYIAIPCMTFVWFFSTTRVDCQLTNLENHLRKELGLKRIGGFVGHYFVKPIKFLMGKRKSV